MSRVVIQLYLTVVQDQMIWKKGSCWLQEVWGWTSWKIVRRIDLTVLFFQIDLSEDTWVKLWRCFCDVSHCLSFWIESASQEMSKFFFLVDMEQVKITQLYIWIIANPLFQDEATRISNVTLLRCQVQILLRIEWCKSEGWLHRRFTCAEWDWEEVPIRVFP